MPQAPRRPASCGYFFPRHRLHGGVAACGVDLLLAFLPLGQLRRRGPLAPRVPVAERPPWPNLHGMFSAGFRRWLLIQPQFQTLDAGPSHHHPVVHAKSRRRTPHLQIAILGDLPEALPHCLVRSHAAGHDHRGGLWLHLHGPLGGSPRALAEVPHRHILEGGRDVRARLSEVRLGQFLHLGGRDFLVDERAHGGLEAREREVAAFLKCRVSRLRQRLGQLVQISVPLLGQSLKVGAAWDLRDAQCARGLVEGLTDRIVDGAPQDRVVADASGEDRHVVATGHQQRQKWKGRRQRWQHPVCRLGGRLRDVRGGQARDEHVSLHVVDPDHRQPVGGCDLQRFAHPHLQTHAQARANGHGHGRQLRRRHASAFQRLLDSGVDGLAVPVLRQAGHDAAPLLVDA
mmetsp:Transcript_70977/g.203429  ORF Transcript_70977/g.203429 Transcript_70977/m.203429 type:complete len:401 (+) Transcript_70977:55-1257(+)